MRLGISSSISSNNNNSKRDGSGETKKKEDGGIMSMYTIVVDGWGVGGKNKSGKTGNCSLYTLLSLEGIHRSFLSCGF